MDPARLSGQQEPDPEQIALQAGPLSLMYERGDLRYVRLGDREIVRRIYVAVRDANWGTVPAVLSNERIERKEHSFSISYTAVHREGPTHFIWQASIVGREDGSLTFGMDGKALSTFWRNRIGFCILHPMDLEGCEIEVTHSDGSITRGIFPVHISPHQPFRDMKAISLSEAVMEFEDDIFEMEDQRNWTDASYKTYCTPLEFPFPVEVPRGTVIRQAVRLRARGSVPRTVATTPRPELTPRAQALFPLPEIGLGWDGRPLSDRQRSLLRRLAPAHLRVEADPGRPGFDEELRVMQREAEALGTRLELVLRLSDNGEWELAALAGLLGRLKPPVARFLVFHRAQLSTGAEWIHRARELLGPVAAGAELAAGTDAFFAELNRDRPAAEHLDALVYSVNPQVHAFDNLSLVENLPAQRATVESALAFAGGRKVVVSPVTFRMRWNPNATGPEPPVPAGELPPQADVRQLSLFGAGWTLGSIKYLALGRAASITFFDEVAGFRGIMEREVGSPLPHRFPSIPGGAYPVYHALAAVREYAGGELVETVSSQPLQVDGLLLRRGTGSRWLLASYSGKPLRVRVHGLPPRSRSRSLRADSYVRAAEEPAAFRDGAAEELKAPGGECELELEPYEVRQIDWEGEE